MQRRMRKLESIREELDAKESSHQTYHGPEEADYGIITFGSQQGTVEEAVDRLTDEGHSVKSLGVSGMMPLAEAEISEFLSSVDEALVVEMTGSAQFRGLIQKELGRFGPKMHSLLKYNGNPFEPSEIVDGFESIIGEDEPAPTTQFVPAAGD